MNIKTIIKKHHANDGGFCRHYLTLYSMILGMESKLVFEFGAGFSSQVILEALKKTNGKLISVDLRDIKDTGNNEKDKCLKNGIWTFHQGDSLDIVPRLDKNGFDVVLHDGSHEADVVEKDIINIVPKMRTNAILMLHDTEHPEINYNLNKALINAFKGIKYSVVTLPYGYGLTIARIEEDFGNGSIDLKWRKGK